MYAPNLFIISDKSCILSPVYSDTFCKELIDWVYELYSFTQSFIAPTIFPSASTAVADIAK